MKQTERRRFAQDLVDGEVTLGAREFDVVLERLTQPLFAVKGQHVEQGVDTVDPQSVAAVIKESTWQYAASHTLSSLDGAKVQRVKICYR